VTQPDQQIKWEGAKALSISNSEIQTFKRCRRKWYLSHYLEYGMPTGDVELGARSIGIKIHLAMDAWYATTVAGYTGPPVNPVQVIEELYEEDIVRWPNAAHELGRERELCRAMLEGYVEWLAESGADEFFRLVATETTVETESPVPGVKIRGRLDQRVVRSTDGARLFLDHKTKDSINEQARLLPLDEQMKMYSLLEYLDALNKTGGGPPERTDGGIYNILRRVKRTATAKPPFYGRIEVRHNMETLRSMWLRVQKVIEEMVITRQNLDAGGDHRYWAYPTPDGDCSWKCPFLSVCPMMDDGSNWEGLLEEHFVKVDPYERYGDGKIEKLEEK